MAFSFLLGKYDQPTETAAVHTAIKPNDVGVAKLLLVRNFATPTYFAITKENRL